MKPLRITKEVTAEDFIKMFPGAKFKIESFTKDHICYKTISDDEFISSLDFNTTHDLSAIFDAVGRLVRIDEELPIEVVASSLSFATAVSGFVHLYFTPKKEDE